MPTTFRSRKTLLFPLVISFLIINCMVITRGAAFARGARSQKDTPPPSDRGGQPYEQWLAREVTHQLNLLPWVTVFDNLGYRVDGSEVTLTGQVVNPVIKDEAGKAVKDIEGVTKINNNIQVLPLSPFDHQIRLAEYRSIYGEPQLQRYALGSMATIRIIVANGHVTLEGFVDNQTDKNIAGIRAKSVANVFSVENNLQIHGGRPPDPQ
jgi:hyperosmotically inducible periplasmic protein